MNAEVRALVTKLSQTSWYYIHKRRRTPLYSSLMWEGISCVRNTSAAFDSRLKEFIYLDGEIAAREESWEDLRQTITRALAENPRSLLQLLAESYQLDDQIVQFTRSLQVKDFHSITDAELLSLWKRYVQYSIYFATYACLPLPVAPDMEEQLRKVIREVLREDQWEIAFQALTTPIKGGTTLEEEQSMLQLAVAEERGEDTRALLNTHMENFAWTKNNAFDGSFATPEEIRTIIRAVVAEGAARKQAAYLERIGKQQELFNTYYTTLSKNKRTQVLIDTLQESIYFRSWRTERYYRNAYFLQSFFRVTAEQLGLPAEHDLLYLMPREILASIEQRVPVPTTLIAERKNGYLMYADSEQVHILSGEALTYAKEHIRVNTAERTEEITGTVAFRGKVIGRVCVVLTKQDLDKVQEGDILVSPSTTVDYVPTLKRVVAIVTEEGGVLSHASVISRELHIPCVIGTKVATQVFVDGDLIEVDAENGIVRKL